MKMNSILIVIYYYSILSVFLVNSTKPKLCINCKYFKNDLLSGSSFGKCILFPIVTKDENSDYLVNGIKSAEKVDYNYCAIVRKYDDRCGKDGKLYEKKKVLS